MAILTKNNTQIFFNIPEYHNWAYFFWAYSWVNLKGIFLIIQLRKRKEKSNNYWALRKQIFFNITFLLLQLSGVPTVIVLFYYFKRVLVEILDHNNSFQMTV